MVVVESSAGALMYVLENVYDYEMVHSVLRINGSLLKALHGFAFGEG